jgi:hypothetical protein
MAGLAALVPVAHAPAPGSVSPAPGTPAGSPPPGAPRHAAARHGTAARAAVLRTTPSALRAGTAAAIAAAALLAAVIAVAFSEVAAGLSAIGDTDAPEVTAATGLYFSLNDMDAQVANMLLAGTDPALAAGRPQYLAAYDRDRETAYADLQQAAVTAAGNAAAERQIRAVLIRTGQYESLAADALLVDQQDAPATAAKAGPSATAGAPAAAVAYYRQATGLMRAGILPQVAALTTVSSAKLDASYSAGRSAAGAGTAVAVAAGLLLIAVLGGFQAFLARRFRRRVNPALAAATLVAVALTVTAGARLGAESGHLRVAKSGAFDSIIALSQARAVSYAANADESRYLADPGRAARYQASFLAESQQLASAGSVPLSRYQPALAADFSAWQADHADVRFGGYLGAELRNITFPGERAAAVTAMQAYLEYQQADAQLRHLAASDPRAAAEFDTGTQTGQSDWAFSQYDQAVTAVIGINQRAFTAAVAAGQGGAAGWDGLVPAGCAILIAALVLIGVRPRLAEYR